MTDDSKRTKYTTLTAVLMAMLMVLSVFVGPAAAAVSTPSIDAGSQEVASGDSISGTFQVNDTTTDVQIALNVGQTSTIDSAITVSAANIDSTSTDIPFSGLPVPASSADGTADVVFVQQAGKLSSGDTTPTGDASTTVTIDDKAPTVNINSAPDVQSTESALTVNYDLTDTNTVASSTLTLTDANGDTLQKTGLATGNGQTVSFDLTNLPDGSAAEGDYKLDLSATDGAGNTASTTSDPAGTVDDTAPSLNGAITGDSLDGNSTANDKILIDVSEDAGIVDSTVAPSDFQVQFYTVNAATVTANDNIELTLGSPLANDETRAVYLQNGESISDTAGNTVTGPLTVADPPTDGLSPQDPNSVTFQSSSISADNADAVKVDVGFASQPEAGTAAVTLSDNSGNSITNTASLDTSSITTTVTLNASQGVLNEEKITATATVADTAGNTNPGGSIGANTVTKDASKPSVDAASITNSPIAESNTGNAQTVTVDFSEDLDPGTTGTITIVRPNNPDISATGISFNDNGGTNNQVTASVTIPDDNEEVTADIAVSGFADTAGNLMDPDSSNTFDIDTVAPQDPNAPSFQANSINLDNEGTVSVDVGFDSAPESGTVTVQLKDATGNTVSGTTTADGSSSSFTVDVDASTLNDETVTASAKIVDDTGNTNPTGFISGGTVEKDTVRPQTPNSVTVQNDDDGQAVLTSGDSLDSVGVDVGFGNTLSEDVTVTVELTDGSTTQTRTASGTSGANGVSVAGFNASKFAEGTVTPSAKVTDIAGNDNQASGPFTTGTTATKDTAGPVIDNFDPADGDTVGSTPATITLDIADTTSTVDASTIAVTLTDSGGTVLSGAGTSMTGIDFNTGTGTLTIDTTSSGIDKTLATGDVTVTVDADDTLANSNSASSTFTVADIGSVSVDSVSRQMFGVVDDAPTTTAEVTVSATADGNTVQQTTGQQFTLELVAADGTSVGTTNFDISGGSATVGLEGLTGATTPTGVADVVVSVSNDDTVNDTDTIELVHETKDVKQGYTLLSTPMNVDTDSVGVSYTEGSINDITTWDDSANAYVTASPADVNQGYYVEASSDDAIVGYEYDTSPTETPGTATLEAGWNLVGSNYDISSGGKSVTKTADTDLLGFSTAPEEIVVGSSSISNYEGYWVYVGSNQTRVLEIENYDPATRDNNLAA